jgi:KilA-N domain
MTTQLITAHFGEMPVLFLVDGFINATAIAKQFNKQPKDYLKSRRTQEYIESIRRILLMEQNQLVRVQNGGNPQEIGTWLHPKLAIDFARWLSSDFAVWCDLQIEKILHSTAATFDLVAFLKTTDEPITLEDFNWRKKLLTRRSNV